MCIRDRITGLTIWGLADDVTWIKGQKPLLFSTIGNPKTAYWSVLQAYKDSGVTQATVTPSSSSSTISNGWYYIKNVNEMCIRDRSATAAQMSSLSDANKSMEEAVKADNRTDAAETKKDQPQKAENTQENADTTTDASDNADVKTETAETIKNPASESGQSVVYTPIDIRL